MHTRAKTAALFALLALGGPSARPVHAAGETVTWVPTELVQGSIARVINSRGTISGETGSADENGLWSLWTLSNGELTDEGKISQQLHGLNNLGWVCGAGTGGGFVQYDGERTYLFTGLGSDVNDLGTVTSGNPAGYWEGGTAYGLPVLTGQGTVAEAINNRGEIVGASNTASSGGWHATLWARPTPTDAYEAIDLGLVGGVSSWATNNNNRGWVVGFVRYESGADHAVLWRDGVGTDIDDFAGGSSQAFGVNERGQVVGIMASPTGGAQRGFVWEDGVAAELPPLPNGERSGAYSINACGEIVGYSFDQDTNVVSAVKWVRDPAFTCDTTAPTIECPNDVAVDPTSASGAVVTYAAPTVSDDEDSAPVVTCVPASGTVFPIGTTTVTCTATDESGNSSECQFHVMVRSGISEVGPANVWIGLKNSDDVGTKFDLLAEVLQNDAVIGSGQVDSVTGGSSGFNNAIERAIAMSVSSGTYIGSGDRLGFRLSVRIAATGHRSGTARLWFGNATADSRFVATIGGTSATYYLTGSTGSPSSFALSKDSAGSGSRAPVDVKVDRAVGGNPFKSFGTWTYVLP